MDPRAGVSIVQFHCHVAVINSLITVLVKCRVEFFFWPEKLRGVPVQNVAPKEMQIARRMAWFREQSLCSREDLAKLAHVKRGAISRVELGRVRLSYSLARQLVIELGDKDGFRPVNPLWLADGVGPVQLDWAFFWPRHDALRIPQIQPFSQFVATHRALLEALIPVPKSAVLPESWLEPYAAHFGALSNRFKWQSDSAGVLGGVLVASAQALAQSSPKAAALLPKIKLVASSFPGGSREFLMEPEVAALRAEARGEFFHWSEISKTPIRRDKEGNLIVDKTETPSILAGVSSDIPTWKALVNELKRLTKSPGAKSQLAKDLGTSRQNVHKWLHDSGEPSVELALEVLRWVRKRQAEK